MNEQDSMNGLREIKDRNFFLVTRSQFWGFVGIAFVPFMLIWFLSASKTELLFEIFIATFLIALFLMVLGRLLDVGLSIGFAVFWLLIFVFSLSFILQMWYGEMRVYTSLYPGWLRTMFEIVQVITVAILLFPSSSSEDISNEENNVDLGEFTIEDVPTNEQPHENMTEEVKRLVDWYLQRRQDGVSPEELEQAMRKAGYPEERIEEVLQRV